MSDQSEFGSGYEELARTYSGEYSSALAEFRRTMIGKLLDAKASVIREGGKPRVVYMSKQAHEALARELAPGAIEVSQVIGLEVYISSELGDEITILPEPLSGLGCPVQEYSQKLVSKWE